MHPVSSFNTATDTSCTPLFRYPSVMTMPDGNILIVGGGQQVCHALLVLTNSVHWCHLVADHVQTLYCCALRKHAPSIVSKWDWTVVADNCKQSGSHNVLARRNGYTACTLHSHHSGCICTYHHVLLSTLSSTCAFSKDDYTMLAA